MCTQPDQTQLLETSLKVLTSTKHSKFKEVSQPINMPALKLQMLRKTTGLLKVQETVPSKTPTEPIAHAIADASHSRTLLPQINGG